MSTAVAPEPEAIANYLDRASIEELVRMERFWRDQGDWEKLAEAFTEDSWVRTTWFPGGSGKEFTEASREMAQRGRHSKHLITPTSIRINGDRALSESLAEIHNRSVLDGVEVDMIQYCRFFSRVSRAAGGWRLASFEGIYQWDVIAPTNPNETVAIDWDAVLELRAPYRIWAYALQRRGYEVDQESIVADDRPDLVKAFYDAAEEWLAGQDRRDGSD